MYWSLTVVHGANPQEVPVGNYVSKSDIPTGVHHLGFATVFIVPIAVVAAKALLDNLSPLALSASQIEKYIIEHYQCL
jgi:hypothetical protein